jgi:hypothetical protein
MVTNYLQTGTGRSEQTYQKKKPKTVQMCRYEIDTSFQFFHNGTTDNRRYGCCTQPSYFTMRINGIRQQICDG